MALELNIILAYAVGLILLYIASLILYLPLKWLVKLIWNAILGGLILFFINLIGGIWGIYLAINPFTALLVGLLGIPGLIFLFLLKYVL